MNTYKAIAVYHGDTLSHWTIHPDAKLEPPRTFPNFRTQLEAAAEAERLSGLENQT
jgi:hypothetical protein